MSETPSTMEAAEDNVSKGAQPAQFDGADTARSKHGALARREYDNMALEASERGQASAGPAAGENGHGYMEHSAVRIRAEAEDKKPQRARPEQEPNG